MVISELIFQIKSMLLDNAEFEAREIVMSVLGLSRNDLIIKSRDEVNPEKVNDALEIAKRRQSGEPLQYILGTAEFMSLDFKVSRETLIPRSDTETLVEFVLHKLNDKKASVLDIGTGTGCIGISLGYYNKKLDVTLADFKQSILETASENAKLNCVDVNTVCIDIMNEKPHGKFDVIVSNPPYIESDVIPTLQTEVKDFEPVTALDGGTDGLDFYRRITELTPELLNKGGLLAFEIGYNQGKEVYELMQKDFEDLQIVKDLCGNDRVVAGVIK